MTKNVKAKNIADFLEMDMHGEDCVISSVASYISPEKNSIVFVEKPTVEAWEFISNIPDILVLCPEEFGTGLNCATIWTDSPRLVFIRVVNEFFSDMAASASYQSGIGEGAVISSEATIGKNVSIGINSVIGADVIIGDNTIILNNVSIDGRTKIGVGCFIKSGAVIGETGFGFCIDEDGLPVQMPHFGSVVIGENVSIGANTTIERGMFENTVISDNVKIDDLVQVGHNVNIASNARIAAGVILCGSVSVGQNCWIAPNSTILERLQIGKDAFIGLASNVIENVEPETVVVGNPGKKIRKINKSEEKN